MAEAHGIIWIDALDLAEFCLKATGLRSAGTSKEACCVHYYTNTDAFESVGYWVVEYDQHSSILSSVVAIWIPCGFF